MIQNDDYIERNIEDIRRRVKKAAEKFGRKEEEIKIIAVTKTVEPERISRAIHAGLVELGENRVQELCEKYDVLDRSCKWHLIGHLQTNKVKYIIDKVEMIHSLDRLDLAEELQRRAQKADKQINVLLQVNVAGEDTKFGVSPEAVRNLLEKVRVFPNLRIKGLMTIAPIAENPEDVRCFFRELYEIFIDIGKENIDNIDMDYLSMGMSNDFEVAIEEGANIIRVGTSIFGRRQY